MKSTCWRRNRQHHLMELLNVSRHPIKTCATYTVCGIHMLVALITWWCHQKSCYFVDCSIIFNTFKGLLQQFSIVQIVLYWEFKDFKKNGQNQAVEAEISWRLLPSMGQAPKRRILHFPQCNSMASFITPTSPVKYPHRLNAMAPVYNTGFLSNIWSLKAKGLDTPGSKTAKF